VVAYQAHPEHTTQNTPLAHGLLVKGVALQGSGPHQGHASGMPIMYTSTFIIWAKQL